MFFLSGLMPESFLFTCFVSSSEPPINCVGLGFGLSIPSIWLVSFMGYDLGYIDLEEKALQPLDNPFGPRIV